MCGIAGKIVFGDEQPVGRQEIQKMNDKLQHRGPDGEGIYVSPKGNIGLGHRRLAVIDLSPAGQQPMSNEDETVWLVFNGEIYNFQSLRSELEKKGHKFKSKTDSEVIIHLWEDCGERCLAFLRGMFAFAIWDEKQQKLFLARDRVGQKPLKYYLDEQCLIFASELKAILEILPRRPAPDLETVAQFLRFNHVPAPRTGFTKIAKLPAAHYALWHKGRLVVKRYWQLDFKRKTEFSYQESKGEILRLLRESVKMQLVSDVPLGVFLSGGIDSSTVVVLASEFQPKLKTFTIGFGERDFDERPLARLVSQKFGTDHTELEVKPDAIDALPKLIYHYEEPYADSSALPTFYLSQLARDQVIVALNGDGGDEAFGGYRRYLYWRWLHRFRKNFYRQIASYRYFDRRFDYLFTSDFLEIFDRSVSEENLQNLDDVFNLSFNTFLPDDLLVKVDIASMVFGLEARSPFLDHQLLEFSASLPPSWKVGWSGGKKIIRDIAGQFLPPEVMKGKRGFELPVDDWFRNDLFEWARDLLLGGKIKGSYFRVDGLERLLMEHRGGYRNHGQRLWMLTCLESWQRQFLK